MNIPPPCLLSFHILRSAGLFLPQDTVNTGTNCSAAYKETPPFSSTDPRKAVQYQDSEGQILLYASAGQKGCCSPAAATLTGKARMRTPSKKSPGRLTCSWSLRAPTTIGAAGRSCGYSERRTPRHTGNRRLCPWTRFRTRISASRDGTFPGRAESQSFPSDR